MRPLRVPCGAAWGRRLTLWISSQILPEYLAAVTRPQATAPGLPMETAIRDVRRFRMAFRVAEERASALDRLIEILSAHHVAGRQVHDANTVATMPRLQNAPIAHVQRHGFPAVRTADRDRPAAVRAAAPRRQRTSFSG
jgi:hypothetical protein